jgi:hypothetical protein
VLLRVVDIGSFEFIFFILNLFFYIFKLFNVLILKIIFLKKYYFNIFSNKKHFKKQLLTHYQTPRNI